MRILVLSDIHANNTALEAVLAHAGEIDAAWCLGDLIGYGPDPNECVARIRQLPKLSCIIGNHDAAALQQIDDETFNPEARTAIHWTRRNISEDTVAFLNALPEIVELDQVTLSHGSPRHPVWEYLLDIRTATLSFEYFNTPYCFVGHTHLPVLYLLPDEGQYARLVIPEPEKKIGLQPRAILNPGSIGQPRDRDPRASYAIFDPDASTWEVRRVGYDIRAVQERMTQAGLPAKHIQRLSAGW
jgi:diadenosine tetraphosphatase ApaH/serine/threonine PP2A family protein phosphatase